jgi:hypothetical protein
MATLMAHGDPVNGKKVSSSYLKDAASKRVLLQYYLLEAQKYPGAFVAMMQPTRGASSSAVAAPLIDTPAHEVS